MRKRNVVVFTLATVFVLPVVHAAGQGVRLDGSVTQTFDLPVDTGDVFGSRTGLRGSVTTENDIYRLSVSSGISLAVDTDGTFELSRPSVAVSYAQGGKDTRLTAGLSFSRGPTSYSEEQPDLTVLSFDTTQTTIGANAALSRDFDSVTTGSLSFGITSLDYDPVFTDLAPSVNYKVSGRINRELNNTLSAGVNLGLGYLVADNAAETQSLSADLSVDALYAINNTSTFGANIGIAFINTSEISGFLRVDEWSTSLAFGASYQRELPDGSLNISLSQDIVPASDGTLALSTGLRAGLNKTINERSSFGVTASLDRQADLDGGSAQTLARISPTYSVQLTPDISANASFTLQREDDGDMTRSAGISFSRPFSFPLN